MQPNAYWARKRAEDRANAARPANAPGTATSRAWLLQMFATRTPINIFSTYGPIAALEHEDGSGLSFNVTIQTARGRETHYVRCDRP